MPRPRKPRECGCQAGCKAFRPTGVPFGMVPKVSLARDELEVLRLCDLEGLTQEEAGSMMGVSRGTVQRTVKAARAKVVRALVEGQAILLDQEEDDDAPVRL